MWIILNNYKCLKTKKKAVYAIQRMLVTLDWFGINYQCSGRHFLIMSRRLLLPSLVRTPRVGPGWSPHQPLPPIHVRAATSDLDPAPPSHCGHSDTGDLNTRYIAPASREYSNSVHNQFLRSRHGKLFLYLPYVVFCCPASDTGSTEQLVRHGTI